MNKRWTKGYVNELLDEEGSEDNRVYVLEDRGNCYPYRYAVMVRTIIGGETTYDMYADGSGTGTYYRTPRDARAAFETGPRKECQAGTVPRFASAWAPHGTPYR